MKKIDYFDLFISPLKYKKQIFLINIIVIILTIFLIILSKILPSKFSYLPNVYTAEAKILLPTQEKTGVKRSAMEEISDAMELTVQRGIRVNQLIISILQSNSVVDQVIEKVYINKNEELKEAFLNNPSIIGKLRKEVLSYSMFSEDNSTGFIYIKFTDIDPIFAKQMVDVYLEMLGKAIHKFTLTPTAAKKLFIEERIKEIEEKLNIAKKTYIEFQQEYGIVSPEREAEQITDTISDLRAELIKKENDLARYNRTHNLTESERTELEMDIYNLRRRIINLTKGNQEELKGNTIMISKSRISELSLEFAKLKRNVENLEYIHISLLNELEIAQIQEKSEGPIIQIIDEPEIPLRKSGPPRTLLFLQIVGLIFFISLFIPVIIEFFKKYILSDPDFRQKIEILSSYISFKKNI